MSNNAKIPATQLPYAWRRHPEQGQGESGERKLHPAWKLQVKKNVMSTSLPDLGKVLSLPQTSS